MNGFLNVLKPPGMSSAAVVSFVKRMANEKHVGHAGTLDPEAAGVLPLMLGRATRLFDCLVDKEKSYVAECAFGFATDTQDAQGQVIASGMNYPSLEAVRRAAESLTGDIVQRPSMYSAIKVDGKPLYARARKGESVDVPERTVHVERIEIQEERPGHGVLMHIDCGRGTYIRSICDDLGKLTGCPAHMRFLLRSRSGVFDLSTSMTLEEIQRYAEAGELSQRILPLDYPLGHLQAWHIPEWMEKPALNGAHLRTGHMDLDEGTKLRMYFKDTFLGIAAYTDGELVWKTLILPDAH